VRAFLAFPQSKVRGEIAIVLSILLCRELDGGTLLDVLRHSPQRSPSTPANRTLSLKRPLFSLRSRRLCG